MLSIRNLHAQIGARKILKGVDLEVRAGEVHAIMNLAKMFRISESKSLQLRIDASNVLNHPIPNTPQLSLAPSAATNALNTSFGQILNATGFSTIGAKTGYRKVQAGVRFTF